MPGGKTLPLCAPLLAVAGDATTDTQILGLQLEVLDLVPSLVAQIDVFISVAKTVRYCKQRVCSYLSHYLIGLVYGLEGCSASLLYRTGCYQVWW
jgi:hypothetical protein